MIRISCPWCGPRNVGEFHHHGEAIERPDTSSVDETGWRRYLYFRTNSNTWVDETWYHAAGCRHFFQISRNTTTNETATVSTQ